MTNSPRRLDPGLFIQGEDERITYVVDFSAWGNPSTASVVVKADDGTDVTSSVHLGSPNVSGSTVTTGCIHSLTAGCSYRVEVAVSISGLTYEGFFYIVGEE